MKTKKSFFSVLLCFIPGAAHLYMGLKRQGLQLMTLFLLPLFLIDFVRISTFMLLIPIIWCYSFFDALRKLNGEEEIIDSDLFIFQWVQQERAWSHDKHRLVAYGLIGLGILLIFQRVFLPLISTYFYWQVREYIEVGVISLLLIGGGIKILAGNRKDKGEEKIWEDGE